MKMKNSEVIEKYVALADIMNRKEKYPVKFSFAMSKNLKALDAANKDFEEARAPLLDDYNVKNEAGEPEYKTTGKINIAAEHKAAWKKSVDELLEIEVEVPVHEVELSVLEGLDIEPAVLYACDFMLKE